MMISGNVADASIEAAPSTPSEGITVPITAAKATASTEIAVDGVSAAFPAPLILYLHLQHHTHIECQDIHDHMT